MSGCCAQVHGADQDDEGGNERGCLTCLDHYVCTSTIISICIMEAYIQV